MNVFPRWVQAGDHDMRVEVQSGRFVDYARDRDGVWRQMTSEMADKESVHPGRHQLGDRPDLAAMFGQQAWPVVDDQMAAWLETTHQTIL